MFISNDMVSQYSAGRCPFFFWENDSIRRLMDSDLLTNMEVGYLASSVHQFINTGSDMPNQIPQEWLSFEIDTAGTRRLGHCYEHLVSHMLLYATLKKIMLKNISLWKGIQKMEWHHTTGIWKSHPWSKHASNSWLS